MTVRTSTFRWQLTYLTAHDYTVNPLRTVIADLREEAAPPPPQAVVITADDVHESMFTEMWPIVREYGVPVTLFIYPSAISNVGHSRQCSCANRRRCSTAGVA